MSHQPFEKWLFSDEPIDPEESEALEVHLNQCEQCRELSTALDQVYETISTVKTPEPSPGFTQRWHQNLAAYREKQQERRIWFFILGLFMIASLILLSLFFINLSNFNESYALGRFIANVSLIAARFNNLLNIARSITRAFPILIPVSLTFGIGLLSVSFALMITWFSSIISLYQPVQERG